MIFPARPSFPLEDEVVEVERLPDPVMKISPTVNRWLDVSVDFSPFNSH